VSIMRMLIFSVPANHIGYLVFAFLISHHPCSVGSSFILLPVTLYVAFPYCAVARLSILVENPRSSFPERSMTRPACFSSGDFPIIVNAPDQEKFSSCYSLFPRFPAVGITWIFSGSFDPMRFPAGILHCHLLW
jgi:hypothetical protein